MNTRLGTIDPPPATELLSLVADFLTQELMPAQSDEKLRYRTRVAANLLQTVRRELAALPDLEMDADGYAVPGELVETAGSLRAFAADLDEGRRSLTDRATFELAARHVDAKLAVADPKKPSGAHSRAAPPQPTEGSPPPKTPKD